MPQSTVYFAHGKESGPWGTKITRLAALARARGCEVVSPDYSSTQDADERVGMLLKLKPRAVEHLILAGSSMGGYVSTVASAHLDVRGLFLLAPAFHIPGYKEQSPKPHAPYTVIVHGWDDEVVPLKNSLRFAKEYRSELHILNSDHRLTSALDHIEQLFAVFLDNILNR